MMPYERITFQDARVEWDLKLSNAYRKPFVGVLDADTGEDITIACKIVVHGMKHVYVEINPSNGAKRVAITVYDLV